MFNGMRVSVSELALRTEPVRRHKWRKRTQSKAYHKRVQKKWEKRWGVVRAPCAYFLADGRLVLHPALYKGLVRSVENDILSGRALTAW